MDKTQLLDLPLDRLIEDDSNVRKNLSGIDELAAEVKLDGILQPILVRVHPERPDHYQIVAGHRRFAAAKRAGLSTIPAIVRSIADNEKTAIQLVENVQREDLSTIEIAHGLKALVEQCGDAGSAAERLGKAKNWVNTHLALLKLDPKVVKAIHKAGLGIAHAREVSTLARSGNVQEAIDTVQALSEGKVKRDDLKRRNREVREGTQTVAAEVTSTVDADRVFERKGDRYSVLVTIGAGLVLDESTERRLDAMLTNFHKVLGVAA